MPQPNVSNEAPAKSDGDASETDGAEVVTLDQFRKKS